MEKQSRKPWTAEARARHKAGVARYQKERAIQDFGNKLYDDIKNFARQNNYDLECTLNSFCYVMRNYLSEPRNASCGKAIDLAKYLHTTIEQKQVEKGIKAA